ncbi:hypothetical protein [Paenarthrobacter nitroguajacolicus]|uniref:hypothetical protein n=1 Tax=Paenarthrobacter nitroguajacolicus TaxID=211146 RepID=UPI00248A9017|nr:hypothetical protein [Paenarthrobacter nitroguajacolicus]MDI2032998.1 hypothetical protein [Paenarthrobacter nitroguajacolicus]
MATARKELSEIKQPEDHKAKVEDFTIEFSGEKFTVKAKAVKDYRILMLLAKVETDASALPEALTKLLGAEQHERMIDAIEDNEGFVDIETVGEFLRELMQAGNRKNS